MSRPVVPIDQAKGHRTIAEKRARKRNEADLLTGSAMQEWPEVRKIDIAHNRFVKTKNLLASIGKDDALLEPLINRYCLLIAECKEFEEKREQFHESKAELQKEYSAGQCGDPEDGGMKASEYYRLLAKMQESIINLDRQIMSKRTMLLNIEKESGMTMMSQLRATTKEPTKETPKNPMESAGFDL
jgi:hypothetical protein